MLKRLAAMYKSVADEFHVFDKHVAVCDSLYGRAAVVCSRHRAALHKIV